LKIQFAFLLFALSAASSSANAAPHRDEAKASRYLYCATLNRYLVETLRDKQPGNPAIEMRNGVSDYFWQATIVLSDLNFAKGHLNDAVRQVKTLVRGADQDHGSSFSAEDLACAKTMKEEVVPLLKAEKVIPDS